MDLVLAAVGWVGAALLLGGYALVTSSRLPGDGVTYQIANLAGSLGLMVNSAYNAAWPSAGLNLIWAGIGAVALVKLARRAREQESPIDILPLVNEGDSHGRP
ncbi:CBU_0592 family membrane protein [Nonomuraea helvata]|uniref:CBU-0592-like domain-containing protein n=1 Tax=Nonomuraea helvata TaxID=37484 RepID=A0ABV5RYG8_9ACTN